MRQPAPKTSADQPRAALGGEPFCVKKLLSLFLSPAAAIAAGLRPVLRASVRTNEPNCERVRQPAPKTPADQPWAALGGEPYCQTFELALVKATDKPLNIQWQLQAGW